MNLTACSLHAPNIGLHLREDNADQRVLSYGYQLGVVSKTVFDLFEKKMMDVKQTVERLESVRLTPTFETNQKVEALGLTPLRSPNTYYEFLKRPEVNWKTLIQLDPSLSDISEDIFNQVEVTSKYEGYIQKEREEVARTLRDEEQVIPVDFDFASLQSVSTEVREKLIKIQPRTLGQASRISGITPAAVGVLSVYLRKFMETKKEVHG
jgi:tRNA uridine 5-carboxymethylaminomethyl modification enzyme